MAKISGPLLSLGARGTIAKTATFSRWKGRPYVRQHVIPGNPNTVAQQHVRGEFKNAAALYKSAPTLVREPWDRYVQGQVMTSYNAFTKFFIQALNNDDDLADMVFSPGAKGGLAPTSIDVTPGDTALSVAVGVPAAPTGWTLQAIVGAAILDGEPDALTDYAWTAAEELTPFSAIDLTSLTNDVQYAVGCWTHWLKPDGSTAFGASLAALATPTST